MSWALFGAAWISSSSTLLAVCYFLFGVTWWWSVLLLGLGAWIAWFVAQRIQVSDLMRRTVSAEPNDRANGVRFLVIFCAFVPVMYLRTADAAVSPWHTAVLVFFAVVFYGVGSWFVLQRGGRGETGILFLHGLLTFGLAQYVFVHGYGFDPAVHEAALREVVAQGQVEPIRFLYSTYYAVLAAVHLVTGIPVTTLSTWVVPVGAALVQALVAPWAFQVLWGATASTARRAAVLLSIVSVPVFILSTPWSASVLLASVAVLLAPLWMRRTVWVVLFFAVLLLAIVLLHPLMGVPVVIAFGCTAAWRMRGGVAVPIAAVLTAAAIVGLFGWLRARAGVAFFEQETSLLDAVRAVVNTYGVRMIFIIAAVGLLVRSRAWIPEAYRRVGVGLGLGMIASAVLLWMFAPAPQVAATDQFEYAWRLLLAALVLLSPVIAMATARGKDSSWYWGICAAALAVSWFVLYPTPWSTQRVVSDADVRIARALPAGTILSDQVFAQAGLKVAGFPSRFPVDVESDSANRSQVMLHQSVADAIRGIEQPLVVVHSYWYRAQEIGVEARAAGLGLLAEEGTVRVYGVVNEPAVR